VPEDPVASLRVFGRALAEVSDRNRAALQISMFDAPTTASSSLKTIVHAEPMSLDRRWRTLISTAFAAGAIRPGVDPRILRHVLHRSMLQAGSGGWDSPADTHAFADCVSALIFDGLADLAPSGRDSKAIRVVDDARARWSADAAARSRQRAGEILDTAISQFALRGFEATTMRDIADAAGVTASNLYRYFESKDSMIEDILGDFSDRLLEAYRDVIQAGPSVVETVDAILWLLDQAGRHFSREIEILQAYPRLRALGLADRHYEGARLRFQMLTSLIERGVAAGELNEVAEPALVASCLREIMWAPMQYLAHVSPVRVRDFYRHSVLSGTVTRR
jgi:AcrR family transcriptional regulator